MHVYLRFCMKSLAYLRNYGLSCSILQGTSFSSLCNLLSEMKKKNVYLFFWYEILYFILRSISSRGRHNLPVSDTVSRKYFFFFVSSRYCWPHILPFSSMYCCLFHFFFFSVSLFHVPPFLFFFAEKIPIFFYLPGRFQRVRSVQVERSLRSHSPRCCLYR
jgi:hypothetical protein